MKLFLNSYHLFALSSLPSYKSVHKLQIIAVFSPDKVQSSSSDPMEGKSV
jgi:hypothetical protein